MSDSTVLIPSKPMAQFPKSPPSSTTTVLPHNHAAVAQLPGALEELAVAQPRIEGDIGVLEVEQAIGQAQAGGVDEGAVVARHHA